MSRHHAVHVTRNIRQPGWIVLRQGRSLGTYSTQQAACVVGMRIARRNRVDLVIHGRNGRIRSKDSYGNEGPARDTEH
jgi:hypothetical protein